MTPETGQFFGPYEILGHLGAGGMGTVLRAFDPRLHREVAIKMLHAGFEMEGMRDRFLREARAVSALNHPHIATIFDIGEQDGQPYMVMELLEGETVRDRIERGNVSLEEIIAIGAQTSEALAEAHAKGIVHRDIKPANIFLIRKASGETHVKVLDFGLAKVDGSDSRTRMNLTATGSAVGTVAYMSPEQARGESLDGRSDLFSLGTVLYEMATGQVPFNGATSALVFVGLLSRDPEPIRDWNRSVPKELEKVVFKALEKDRTERYQKAIDLKRALEQVTTKKGWFSRGSAPVIEDREQNNDPIARDRKLVRRKSAEIRSVTRPDVRRVTPVPPPPPPDSDPVAGITARRPGSSSMEFSASMADSAAHAAESRLFAESSASKVRAPQPAPIEPEEALAEPHFESASGLIDAADASHVNYELAQAMQRKTPGGRMRRRRKLVSSLVGVALLAVVTGGFLYSRTHRLRPLLQPGEGVLVGVIANRTGDTMLDDSVRQALAIDLKQSPYFNILSDDQLAGGLAAAHIAASGTSTALAQDRMQPIALAYGAKVYLAGSIDNEGGKYTLSVNAMDADGGVSVASVREDAPDLNGLQDAVDRAAQKLRAALGEPHRQIEAEHIAFAEAATASWPALAAYSLAERAVANAQPLAAIPLYQQAIAADANFGLAYLRLADVSKSVGAEGDAAQYAVRAAALAGKMSAQQKIHVAFAYHLYNGLWDKAAADLDGAGETGGIALQLRRAMLHAVAGDYEQVFNDAQQAGGQHPYTAATYAATGIGLIGLGRFETAEQMALQGERNGFAQPGLLLDTAYLQGKQSAIDLQTARANAATDLSGQLDYGLYLDNTGEWKLAETVWRKAVAMAQQRKLNDLAASYLAQGAYDRALANVCGGTVAMAQDAVAALNGAQASQRTQFQVAMSQTMCGDTATAQTLASTLKSAFPESIPVQRVYVPELQAAAMIRGGNTNGALTALDGVRQYELISIAPYLRGMAHLHADLGQLAIVDFQQVLEHRGPDYLQRAPIYGLAQAGLGEAFERIGDHNNSSASYKAFLQNWHNADADQPLVLAAKRSE